MATALFIITGLLLFAGILLIILKLQNTHLKKENEYQKSIYSTMRKAYYLERDYRKDLEAKLSHAE